MNSLRLRPLFPLICGWLLALPTGVLLADSALSSNPVLGGLLTRSIGDRALWLFLLGGLFLGSLYSIRYFSYSIDVGSDGIRVATHGPLRRSIRYEPHDLVGCDIVDRGQGAYALLLLRDGARISVPAGLVPHFQQLRDALTASAVAPLQ